MAVDRARADVCSVCSGGVAGPTLGLAGRVVGLGADSAVPLQRPAQRRIRGGGGTLADCSGHHDLVLALSGGEAGLRSGCQALRDAAVTVWHAHRAWI